MFAGFGAGAEALRRLEQGGAAPDVARLSDEAGDAARTRRWPGWRGVRADRAARLPARARRGRRLPGHRRLGRARRARARAPRGGHRGAARRGRRRAGAAGGSRVGALALPRALPARRADGPRRVRRDARDGHDVVAALHPLPRGGRRAARATRRWSRCHISHLYPTGASLYFTFMARARRGEELEQWAQVKARGLRGHRRRRRDDHPSPRGGQRPRALHGRRGRGHRAWPRCAR